MKRSIFERVREGVNPSEYFARRLPGMSKARPRDDGWTDGGKCPFHLDKHPGSFRVNVKYGMARCFSCDAKAGDVIAFEAMLLDLQPLDAAKALAVEWRVR